MASLLYLVSHVLYLPLTNWETQTASLFRVQTWRGDDGSGLVPDLGKQLMCTLTPFVKPWSTRFDWIINVISSGDV